MKTLRTIFKQMMLVLPITFLACCGASPEATLKKASEEVNKTCPSRVDDITILKETTYENNCFTYYYVLDDDPDSELIMETDYDIVVEVLSGQVKENAITDPNVKLFLEELRKAGATLEYRYDTRDGRSRVFVVDY